MSSSVPSERWRDHFPFPPAFCEVRLYRDHPKTQRSPRRFIGVGGKCLTKTFVCLQREEEGTMDLSYSNLKSSFGFLSLKQNLLFFSPPKYCFATLQGSGSQKFDSMPK